MNLEGHIHKIGEHSSIDNIKICATYFRLFLFVNRILF